MGATEDIIGLAPLAFVTYGGIKVSQSLFGKSKRKKRPVRRKAVRVRSSKNIRTTRKRRK